MAHLDALTIKSAAHAPSSRGIRLIALLASLTFPLGLIYAIYPYWRWSLITGAVGFVILFFPISSIIFLGWSLDALRTPLDGGPETLADELRDIGVVPAPITIFTSLTVVLVALSTFSYYLYFLLRPNVPIWERQGTGSLMLYVNAVVSALEIISAATLIRHLNSVPESLTELSIGNYFYAPAYIGLVSAGISILGIVLMVAGPSSLRLPDSYEPTSKASDHPRRSTPDSANRQAQTNPGVPQAAGNQSLAALYQAQQQQRQQLIIQTKRKFMVGGVNNYPS
ncbi:hypothetical protein E0Z10_g5713 [Xylaria hypoxylon]|uniref:Uncharacterized protein n=1 Tax=Xylaria hypoxylon TaxID=37992 RepID=A0A4Z0YHY2_9PEZI|nr:hypothetical protein E0Z10_g5713 [Xylaria hypoxylon]